MSSDTNTRIRYTDEHVEAVRQAERKRCAQIVKEADFVYDSKNLVDRFATREAILNKILSGERP